MKAALSLSDAADLFRREPDRYLDVGAGEVAYRRVGTGPDVLFVHGWPVSSATFRLLLPSFAEHLTCHLVDLPGSGSSRFESRTPVTIGQHVSTVRRLLDLLEFDDVAVVGHDSGGMIARHAVTGDARLRAMGLIDTEQPAGLGWRFKMFLMARHVPGAAAALGWVAGHRRLRRNRFVLGAAFADAALLDGEFDEFFLEPLHRIPARREAAIRTLRSFETRHVSALSELHGRIGVPVQLVWGEGDPFFPVKKAREMVATFPDATLAVIEGAGLFSHEERPAQVAEALLPFLLAPRR